MVTRSCKRSWIESFDAGEFCDHENEDCEHNLNTNEERRETNKVI